MRQLDEERYTGFVRSSWTRLFRVAYTLTGDRQTAESVLHEALVRAYGSWQRALMADMPEAHVSRILVKQARRLSGRDQRSYHQLPAARDGRFDDVLASTDQVWHALAGLSPRQRALIAFRYVEELSEYEIAEALGLRRAMVRSEAADAMAELCRLMRTADVVAEGAMTLEQRIVEAVSEKSAAAAPPPLRIEDLIANGRRRAVRHRLGLALAMVAAIAVGVTVANLTVPQHARKSQTTPQGAPSVTPRLADTSKGLRAYADSGSGMVHIGDTVMRIPKDAPVEDATATPYGLLHFDADGRPYFLTPDGKDTPLEPNGMPQDPQFFDPSPQYDAVLPLVAWVESDGATSTINLYDVRAREFAASFRIPCEGCGKVQLAAVDQGLVFARTLGGNMVWNPKAEGEAAWTYLGGSPIADVRNKVVMMTGAPPGAHRPAHSPIGAGWSFVSGKIDAKLSHDGKWRMYFSKTLQPADGDGAPIVLDVPYGDVVAFDTDGSVLVASRRHRDRSITHGVPGKGPTYDMYDCLLPSGSCTRIGDMMVIGGDPQFMDGDDS